MSRSKTVSSNKYQAVFRAGAILVILLLLILFVLHIAFGKVFLHPEQVLRALANIQEEQYHRQIVWGLRLPRTLIALAAGAMLGLAGAILQSATRNPLAEPGLLGVSAGSVLLIVLWVTFGAGNEGHSLSFPLFALAGGVGSVAIVYAISWSKKGDIARLALSGVLVGAVLQSCTSLILLRHTEAIGSILLWTIGSLNGRVWVHWDMLWPWALLVIPLGMLSAGVANALQLGDGIARGIGLPVRRARALLLLLSALLTAGAVSAVGAVGFVGLIGPHIARKLVGLDARRLFPFSALITALLLLGADVLAQIISFEIPLPGTQIQASLPVGAVTAFMGAPFFLYLIRKQMK